MDKIPSFNISDFRFRKWFSDSIRFDSIRRIKVLVRICEEKRREENEKWREEEEEKEEEERLSSCEYQY